MSSYTEHEARRAIIMVSADGGATWYPRGGNAALAAPMERNTDRVIKLKSHDVGVTWVTT
jgi:hypothetical protein